MNSAQTNILELEKRQGEEYQKFLERQTEIETCSDSLSFLKRHGRIRDKLKGIIPWEDWPHLVYLLDCLRKYRFIIILKAKQIGITWLMAGANLHLATYVQGANILTLSKGEAEAGESLDYSRFIHNQLPDFLRLPLGKDQASLITFPAMHSKIRALSSTEDAGVGFGGATRVVFDEFEYHDYAEQNFAEIYSAVERGGQLVVLSTADNTKEDTKFKELYNGARAGRNNFYPIFFSRCVLPERTQEWFDNLDMPQWQKECRFPLTEKDALSTLKSHKFFQENMLDIMYADCNFAPLEHELSDKYNSVKIYRLPEIGKRYCQFTDPSEGRENPHAIIVIDGQTGEEVAESHGKTPADLCAQIHDELVRLYNAFNSYESGPGGAGGIMATKLAELGTPNICPSLNVSTRPFTLDYASGKKGWWAGKAFWDVAIWELEEAVRLRKIIPHSKECLDEFSQFIVPEGKSPQKIRGGRDDYIDAWKGVCLLRKYMPAPSGKMQSYPYRR